MFVVAFASWRHPSLAMGAALGITSGDDVPEVADPREAQSPRTTTLEDDAEKGSADNSDNEMAIPDNVERGLQGQYKHSFWTLSRLEAVGAVTLALGLLFFPTARQLLVSTSVVWNMFLLSLVIYSAYIMRVHNVLDPHNLPAALGVRPPRLAKDWDTFHAVPAAPSTISIELMFNAVFAAFFNGKLTSIYAVDHRLGLFIFLFLMFHNIWSSFMLYAARFHDSDTAHKALWCFYGFGVLTMLASTPTHIPTLCAAAAALYIMLTGFYLRIALMLHRCRPMAIVLVAIHMTTAAMWIGAGYLYAPDQKLHLNKLGYIALLCRNMEVIAPLFLPRRFDLPIDADYVVSKAQGIRGIVLGGNLGGLAGAVARTIDGGTWQGKFPDMASGFVLILFFFLLLNDLQSIPREQHALFASRSSAVGWLLVNPVTTAALVLSAGGTIRMITATDDAELNSAKYHITLAVGTMLLSTAVLRMMHKRAPRDGGQRRRSCAVALICALLMQLAATMSTSTGQCLRSIACIVFVAWVSGLRKSSQQHHHLLAHSATVSAVKA